MRTLFLIMITLNILSCELEDYEVPDGGVSNNVIATVCHNPESIWHLSQCIDDTCRLFDTDRDAYCLTLTQRICEVPREIQSDFVRQACAIYYR